MDGMKSFTRNSRRALPLIVAACAAAMPSAVLAADKKWDGSTGGGNQWDTASNWSNNPAASDGSAGSTPISTDDVIFDNSLRNPIAPVIGLGGSNATANSITFGSTVGTALGAFSLQAQTSTTTGRTLTITSGNVTVDSTVAGTQTLGNAANGTLTLDTASAFTFVNNSTTQALTITTAFVAGKSLSMATAGGAITLDVQRAAPTFASLSTAATGALITNGAATSRIITLNATTGTATFAGQIKDGVGTLGLTKTGDGIQTLSGTNNYSGGTILGGASNLTGGQLNINSATAIGNGSFTVTGPSTIDNTSANAVTLSTNNAVVLSNSLTFLGSKDLNFGTGATTTGSNGLNITLSGSNSTLTFGGTLTNTANSANQSLNVFGVGNTLSLGGFTGGGAHTSGKVLLIGGSANVTFTGAITNGVEASVGITSQGTGTLTLLGNNSYTGLTQVNSGALLVGSTASLPGYNAPAKVTVSAGAMLGVFAGPWTAADIDTLRANANYKAGSVLGINTANSPDGFTYGTTISGSVGLTKLGANTLVLTANNTYSIGTTIAGGTLQIGAGGATGSLGSAAVTNNGTLAINRSDGVSIANVISGTGSFVKAGGGTTTLTGANTFTGSTGVTEGVLKLDSGGSLANCNINLAGGTLTAGTNTSGGTITYRVTGDTADLITLSTGGVLDLTNLKLNLQLTGTQTQSEYVIADKAVGSGFVTGSQFLSVINLGTASIDYDGTAAHPDAIVLTGVPEPGCVSLLGLAAMGFLKRRRRVVG